MAAHLRAYGHKIGNSHLAEVVLLLYKAARANSTRKSYIVGQRHWVRFQNLHPSIPFFPFTTISPDPVSLALCFFVAYLASRPTINRYTTVRSYLCHVKALWRDAGCANNLLNPPLLAAIMRGVRRALPAPPDSRSAFLLPLYLPPPFYLHPPSDHWLMFKAAVALGFHAMLRFGAFCQLTPNLLTAILRNGGELPLSQLTSDLINSMAHFIVGFMFTFSPKYTSSNERVTTAYFCHICDVAPKLAPHCPACVLLKMSRRGLLRFPSRPVFNPNFFTPSALTSYLQLFPGRLRGQSRNDFKPHSLRIGGHTFYTMHGMSADLRDFLARRVINRCSLRYYRASPIGNIRALRDFYASIRLNPTSLSQTSNTHPCRRQTHPQSQGL